MTSTATLAGTPAAATSARTTDAPAPAPAAKVRAASPAPARMSERVDFRSASARLRENAGINDTDAVADVASFAEVGAAARRLLGCGSGGAWRRQSQSLLPPSSRSI